MAIKKPKKNVDKPKKRDEKTKKTKDKIESINDEKYIKPKKDTGRKIARVILWAMIGFIFLRGVVAVAKPDPISEIQRMTNNFIKEQSTLKNTDFEISSFAQNFAREYLTYESGKLDDYQKRVSPYLSGYVTFSEMKNFKNTASASYVKAYKIEPYSKDQYDVYIMAVVNYLLPQTADNGTEIITVTEQESTYFKVPVRSLGQGGYVVEDYPVFVAAPSRNGYEYIRFAGAEVDKAINTAIEGVLTNFLTAYYQENQTRINYFLAPEAVQEDFKGLNGRYQFKKIDSLRSYADPENSNNFVSLAEITVEDRNGQQFTQRFNLLLRWDGSRYYVVEIDTKTVDLKHNFSIS